MKYLKTYRKQYNFCNESIKHFLKGKSKNEIMKKTSNLKPIEKMNYAIKYGIDWLAQEAIDDGIDINMIYIDLRTVVMNNEISILKILINNKISINELNSAILYAIEHNKLDILKLLVNYGCDIKTDDNFIEYYNFYLTYLQFAVIKLKSDDNMVKYLIDNGAYNYIPKEILVDILNMNKFDVIKVLIDNIKGMKEAYQYLYDEHKKIIEKLEKVL